MPYLTMRKNLKLQLSPGLVTSYDIQPGNGVDLFWDITHTHTHTRIYLLTYLLSPARHGEAKKEIHRLTAAHCVSYNISLTSVNRIIKCDVQLKCTLICFMRPLPGSHLIVLVFSVSFIRVYSPSSILFLIRKHLTQACSSITFALSQLLIKYLSSTANPIVAEQICTTPELRH